VRGKRVLALAISLPHYLAWIAVSGAIAWLVMR